MGSYYTPSYSVATELGALWFCAVCLPAVRAVVALVATAIVAPFGSCLEAATTTVVERVAFVCFNCIVLRGLVFCTRLGEVCVTVGLVAVIATACVASAPIEAAFAAGV